MADFEAPGRSRWRLAIPAASVMAEHVLVARRPAEAGARACYVRNVTLAPRNWAHVVFLWLSLATVLAPALIPFGSPLIVRSGSAFSAFTSDVSLGPKRAAEPERDRKYQKAGGGPDGLHAYAGAALLTPSRLWQPPRLAAGAPFPAVPDRGPARLVARGFQARAPPLARA